MIHRYVFLQKKEGLTSSQFANHWRDVHGPIAAKIPGLRKYNQYNLIDWANKPARLHSGSIQVDGFALLSFDSMSAVASGFNETVVAELSADEPKFVSDMALLTTVGIETVVLQSSEAPYRLFNALKRSPGQSAAEFQTEFMRAEGSGLGLSTDAVCARRVVVIGHGFEGLSRENAEKSPIDILEEIGFETEAAMKAALQLLHDDSHRFAKNTIALFPTVLTEIV